jgi:23S rRNA (uracil1939-C5)-methyltransferase
LVLAGIGDARTVADLFSGVGTFSFALARSAKVHAVDGDKPAIAALQSAARRAGANVTGETRDLERRPLLADELKRFDAVVFDPPYAGAAAQTRELARATVRRVVAVSCNPASFARDARTLADGGYRLLRVAPVDQFLWSAEVELVAHFER